MGKVARQPSQHPANNRVVIPNRNGIRNDCMILNNLHYALPKKIPQRSSSCENKEALPPDCDVRYDIGTELFDCEKIALSVTL